MFNNVPSVPRLKTSYFKKIVPMIFEKYQYKNIMEVPRLKKVVISMSMKDALLDSKVAPKVLSELFLISGQKPVFTRAKKSLAAFKLREGVIIGSKVTLRSNTMYEFIDNLINIALPRVRDFHGFTLKQFNGSGGFNFGLKEHIVFPQLIYDDVNKIRGMNISFDTTAKTDEEAMFLLSCFGLPFVNMKVSL